MTEINLDNSNIYELLLNKKYLKNTDSKNIESDNENNINNINTKKTYSIDKKKIPNYITLIILIILIIIFLFIYFYYDKKQNYIYDTNIIIY